MAENYSQIRELYSQLYFEHDKPVPFKDGLLIYPVLVKDYYNFFSLIDVFTVNKNEDISGKGISMSHLDYVVYLMNYGPNKEIFTQKFIALIELVFQFKNGIQCSQCENEDSYMSYQDIHDELGKLEKKKGSDLTQEEVVQCFSKFKKCPICGREREDLIRVYTNQNGENILVIKGIEIDSEDFALLRKIVCYQNMPDYEDDYIDPELKAELEEAAKLKNPNNVTPTLEKQESCIIASTGYTFETIQSLSIRHLVTLLRVIDAKIHYMSYQQGQMSGLVKFEHEYPHWIYSSDKRSKYDTAQTLDQLKDKLADVTK